MKIIAHNFQAHELQMQQHVDEWMKMQFCNMKRLEYLAIYHTEAVTLPGGLAFLALECRHMDLMARYRSHLLFHG